MISRRSIQTLFVLIISACALSGCFDGGPGYNYGYANYPANPDTRRTLGGIGAITRISTTITLGKHITTSAAIKKTSIVLRWLGPLVGAMWRAAADMVDMAATITDAFARMDLSLLETGKLNCMRPVG